MINYKETNPLNRISVIELDFHHDSLDGFLKIFQKSSYHISVFTTTKNIKLLKDVMYSQNIVFYEYTGGLKYFFLRKNKNILNASQIIFINTIANDFGSYLAIDRSNVAVLRVHNVNKQFRPIASIFIPKSWFFVWKSISYILRQIIGKGFLLFRPILNRRVSFFTFPDSSITDYVKLNHFVDESKILPPIPLKIFIENDTAYSEYNDVLNITIIGAIDHRRRQYEQCVDALTSLFKKDTPPTINVTILGKCTGTYGEKVIGELKKISNPRFTLKTYDNQVPETEFINCIKHTHLIISPITNNATTDIFKEIYGKTKTTGSILDFLKFGKVTLVPNHYTPPTEVLKYVIRYENSADLEKIILDLINNKKINVLNKNALEYVRDNYSQASVLEQTISVFKAIAKNE
jgi:glycosyltransferase involved in cell wall biosynthesis